jgi:hypothetical protein
MVWYLLTGSAVFRYNPLTFLQMYDAEEESISFDDFLRQNLTDPDQKRRFVCVFKVNRSGDEIGLDVVSDTDMANVPSDAIAGFLELIEQKSRKVKDSPFACFLRPTFEHFENADYWVGPRFDAKALWDHFLEVYDIDSSKELQRQLDASQEAIARLTQATQSSSENVVDLSRSLAVSVDSYVKVKAQHSSVQKSTSVSSSHSSVQKSTSVSSSTDQNLLYLAGTPKPLLKVVLLNGHYMLYPATRDDCTKFGYSYNSCSSSLDDWTYYVDRNHINEIRTGGCIVDNVAFMMVRVQ